MRIAFLFTCILLFAACNKKEFCIQPAKSAAMTMVFKTYDDNQKLIDSPLINAGVTTTDTSYVYADNVARLSGISVFLNRNNAQQTFEIFQSNQRDTIVVFYNTDYNFISNGCGYQAIFNLEHVTFSKTNIQAVNIKNALINGTTTNHLEVIY